MSKLRKAVGSVASLVFVGGLIVLALNFQLLRDQLRVWQYQPSSAIITLTDRASLSDRGKHYFYLAHPKLEGANEFNQECQRAEPKSALLGCYKPSTETIHLYDVDDPALEGVEEVTAAHEMLHVAYSRLSAAEKKRLSPLLEAAYATVKDAKFEERMAYYERAQPGSRENELHSILATEFSAIGDELEQYYARYFVDRSNIVAWHVRYHQQFEENERQADVITQRLETQKGQIDQAVEQYERDMMVYNQEVEAFNGRAKRGEFSSQAAFSRERAALQSRGERLSQRQRTITSQVDAYNADVERLNALGRAQQRLNNSLDSMKAVE